MTASLGSAGVQHRVCQRPDLEYGEGVSELNPMAQRRALYVTAFFRALTTSLLGVLLGVYLAKLHVTGAAFGAVISSGLIGAALAAVLATFFADSFGRRRFLIALATL